MATVGGTASDTTKKCFVYRFINYMVCSQTKHTPVVQYMNNGISKCKMKYNASVTVSDQGWFHLNQVSLHLVLLLYASTGLPTAIFTMLSHEDTISVQTGGLQISCAKTRPSPSVWRLSPASQNNCINLSYQPSLALPDNSL